MTELRDAPHSTRPAGRAASRPIRVAIANQCDIVAAGLAAVLEPYGRQIAVVDLTGCAPAAGEVDIVLVDDLAQLGSDEPDESSGEAPRVLVAGWDVRPDLVSRAVRDGAAGYLDLRLSAAEIVDALAAVQAGEVVAPRPRQDPSAAVPAPSVRRAGLTARECEVVGLITHGLSNQEIADLTHLSINSVKSYIRTAYRKIGITSRSQVVVWGVQNDLGPTGQPLESPARLELISST